jgi:hypothetical protein
LTEGGFRHLGCRGVAFRSSRVPTEPLSSPGGQGQGTDYRALRSTFPFVGALGMILACNGTGSGACLFQRRPPTAPLLTRGRGPAGTNLLKLQVEADQAASRRPAGPGPGVLAYTVPRQAAAGRRAMTMRRGLQMDPHAPGNRRLLAGHAPGPRRRPAARPRLPAGRSAGACHRMMPAGLRVYAGRRLSLLRPLACGRCHRAARSRGQQPSKLARTGQLEARLSDATIRLAPQCQ